MAGWKAKINYNYNPFHAYTYGIVYSPGQGPTFRSLTGWAENGATDFINYNGGGMMEAYFAGAPEDEEESPPHSSEQHAVNGHGHYQGPGEVTVSPHYVGDTQAGHVVLPGPHQAQCDEQTHQTGSDRISDPETHNSPNSWSSGSSSREGSLPQTDPSTWAKQLCSETIIRSPDVSKDASGSVAEELGAFVVNGNEGTNDATSLELPSTDQKKPCTAAVITPKGKVRAAFSESQMNVLVQRFNVQRYLTPAEMKNLAELTGLTYKQVKTWFQNRRMKLRRHQKDTSWVSERYNKGSPMYANGPPHMPPYQGEVPPPLNQHYNQPMMETAFKNTPQNMAFYLAAMGSAAGSTGYPSWSPNSCQTGMPSRPQVPGWSMPPGVSHYDYNPNGFHPASATSTNNIGPETNFNVNDADPVGSQGPFNMPMVYNGSQ